MTQSWRYAMHKMEISDTLGIVGLLHRFRSSATTLTSLQEGEPSPHQRGTPGTDYIYHPGCNQVTWIFWIFNRNIQPGWTPLPLCLHRGQHPIFQRYSAILGSLAKTWSHNFLVKKSNMFAFQLSILDAYVRSLHCHVMVQALGLVYCRKHLETFQNSTFVIYFFIVSYIVANT